MFSHGLKYTNPEDCEEAAIIAAAMMDDSEDEDDLDDDLVEGAHFADHHFTSDELEWIEKYYVNSKNFMMCFGLKFYNDDDCQEAKAIVRSFLSDPHQHKDEDESMDVDDDGDEGIAGPADHHFTSAELRAIKGDYGSVEMFMLSYGLKYYNEEDCREAKAIARVLVG